MTTESMMRCENLACLCDVPLAQPTCSDYCASREGRDPQNVICSCGHALCAEQVNKQLHGEAASENPA